jgi:DNA-binding beta-propeller fold protein YncE
MHVQAPGGRGNVVIASNDPGQVGQETGARELQAIKDGKLHSGVSADGSRFEIDLPLRDASARTLGGLSEVFAYKPGADTRALESQATAIRDELARRISHVRNLLEPAQLDGRVPLESYAQQLLDQTLERHPDIVIMAMHATIPNTHDNVIVASNIGRIGKKADEDDMRVVNTGKPNLEINETGDRFEAELELEDAAGRNIGAIGIVYAYQSGADKVALQRKAEGVRDEIAREVPTAAKLFEPVQAGSSGFAALRLLGRTELPGYSGDFDHFAVDVAGNRLFLAAEDHGTLEVFDLRSGAHLKTVKGVETPHSILYMPDRNRLLVTDSGSGMTKVLDATTYQVTGAIKLVPGADSIGYDAARKRLYIVTGGKDVNMTESYLAEIDPRTGEHFGDVKFDANHVEAMAIEQSGDRLYINVTDKNYLAVIDTRKRAVVAEWPIKEAQQNAPIALDEAGHRLFVVTRKPGKLIVLDSGSGATVASFTAPERTDEVVYDSANQRVYIAGGEGYIGVIQQQDPDHYVELARIPSAKGAKTAILVPSLHRLYVAVSPGEGHTGAAVIWFDVLPAQPAEIARERS